MNGPLATCWIALAFMGCAGIIARALQQDVIWTLDRALSVIQTFFSVLALAAAIAIAIHEYRNARNQDRRRREDYITLVGELADYAMSNLAVLADAATCEEEPAYHKILKDVRGALQGTKEALQAVQQTIPPDARLALTTRNLVALTDGNKLSGNVMPSDIGPRAIALRKDIQQQRDRLT